MLPPAVDPGAARRRAGSGGEAEPGEGLGLADAFAWGDQEAHEDARVGARDREGLAGELDAAEDLVLADHRALVGERARLGRRLEDAGVGRDDQALLEIHLFRLEIASAHVMPAASTVAQR